MRTPLLVEKANELPVGGFVDFATPEKVFCPGSSAHTDDVR
jgi:hypothetical protein